MFNSDPIWWNNQTVVRGFGSVKTVYIHCIYCIYIIYIMKYVFQIFKCLLNRLA